MDVCIQNTCSSPKDLRITDMKICEIHQHPKGHWINYVIRIDTNQGVCGYGEVRDGASALYAKMLKRVILGENPCNIDKLFRRIQQFGGRARQGGGVCAVEIALWDLVGRIYGIPIWQMLGGQFRDRIRIYCDTDVDGKDTPEAMAEALIKRMEHNGYTFLKMDVGIGNLIGIDDAGKQVLWLCSCREKRQIIRNAHSSNLGELLQKRFSNFRIEEDWQKVMVKAARDFAAEGGKGWLAMLGQTGCGKTHLCSAAANQLLNMGRKVVYMLWTTDARQLKRLSMEEVYDRMFDRFRKADVLYIDDLFKGKITDADVQLCYDLLNFRYNDSRLTTILSSELSLEQIQAVDGAIAGRIRERCGKNFVTVSPDPNKNWRLRQN